MSPNLKTMLNMRHNVNLVVYQMGLLSMYTMYTNKLFTS